MNQNLINDLSEKILRSHTTFWTDCKKLLAADNKIKMQQELLDALKASLLQSSRSKIDKTELLELLSNRNDPKHKGKFTSAVIDILEADDLESIKFLIEHRAIDPNAKDFDGQTALSIAVQSGCIKAVKLLSRQMNAADVEKFNKEQLLGSLEFPKILPELWLVEEVIQIVNLLLKKEITLSLENRLAVLKFLVHNMDDCDCTNESRDLHKNMSDLINYGSPIHIKNVLKEFEEQESVKKLHLDMSHFKDCVGRPLSSGVLFDLYVDKEVFDTIGYTKDDYPFEEHHAAEYALMKAHMLKHKDKLSLHQVLAKHPHEIYEYVNKLDFHKICKKYKCAGDYMKGLKAKSLIRHQVVEFLPDFMMTLFPPLILPDRCYISLLNGLCTLSNENLLSMCEAAVMMKKEEKRTY